MQLLVKHTKWLMLAGAGFGVWLGISWLGQPAVAEYGSGVLSPRPVSTRLASPKLLVVDVVGAVRSPGVVQLPSGSRVVDAVAAAGGLRGGAEAGVNLARLVVDGEQIVVGKPSTFAAEQTGGLNINTATASQLEQLPGIGPVLAQRIISFRDAHGGIKSLQQLDQVSGIGKSLLAELKPLVSFG